MSPSDDRPMSVRWQYLTSTIETRRRWGAICDAVDRQPQVPLVIPPPTTPDCPQPGTVAVPPIEPSVGP